MSGGVDFYAHCARGYEDVCLSRKIEETLIEPPAVCTWYLARARPLRTTEEARWNVVDLGCLVQLASSASGCMLDKAERKLLLGMSSAGTFPVSLCGVACC